MNCLGFRSELLGVLTGFYAVFRFNLYKLSLCGFGFRSQSLGFIVPLWGI